MLGLGGLSPGKGVAGGNPSSPGLKGLDPNPGWFGIRGGRLIGSGCSMDVGVPGKRRHNEDGEDIDVVHNDTSQELQCQAWEPK